MRWAVESSPGRVWQAIRENELRVEVLGLRPHWYKLQAFVLSSTLAAAGGIVYMLLYSGSTLAVTQPNFTLTLLLMVVIGGAGSRWGAVLGGILYTYLNDRLDRDRQLVGGARGCRTFCARRSSSRSSCSASSSSSSSSSCRAGSPASSRAGASSGLRRIETAVRPGVDAA